MCIGGLCCAVQMWNLVSTSCLVRTPVLHDSSPGSCWGAYRFPCWLGWNSCSQQPRQPPLSPPLAGPGMEQPSMICGGPCCHCSRTASPCWRRGPPEKPVLCNACGTRYSVKRSLEGYFPGRRVQKRRTWRSKESVEDSASVMIGGASKRARALGGMYLTKQPPKNRRRGGAFR